jgi:acetoin utilization protein AcuC
MAPFFFHPRMLTYTFGPQHPLKPERLRRTMALLELCAPDLPIRDPGLAATDEVAQVHSRDYIEVVEALSRGDNIDEHKRHQAGFSSSDNPPFAGMAEASFAYCGGAVQAARAVLDHQPLAFNIAGGLHHAMRGKAAGFCIFNDVALIAQMLKARFERVLYVDIDVHHGDGVQALFWNDPRVLTFSIHENPRTLWPGTGEWSETDDFGTALNLPMPAGTTGDVWLEGFRRVLDAVTTAYRPEAVVLQMGTDAHGLDPLAHLNVSAQHWRGAVQAVKNLGLPIVASGGGGYSLQTVPRMWVAAIMTLLERPLEDDMMLGLPPEWQLDRFDDLEPPLGQNASEVQETVIHLIQRIQTQGIGA